MLYLRCLIFAALCGFIGAAVSQTPSNVFVGNIIGPYTSVSSLSASVCGTSAAPQGTLGVVITNATDKGIYYCDSAGWSNTIGYLPSMGEVKANVGSAGGNTITMNDASDVNGPAFMFAMAAYKTANPVVATPGTSLLLQFP